MTLSKTQFEHLHQKLRTDGGFSADAQTGEKPTDGLMVSLSGSEAKIPEASSTPGDLEKFASTNAEALSEPNRYIGGWNEGGHDWVDVSTRVAPMEAKKPGNKRSESKARRDTKRAALSLAKEHDQKAVYDVAADRAIRNPKYSGGRG